MPQVKIKQGSKSAVNNNAGVLNAGTLAITTDTNELFVTHNDGTVHQLCNPVIDTDQIANLAVSKPKLSQDTYDWIDGKVDKAGDIMSGDLDMGGNELKNVAIDVVTSLPTTNNFVSRQVTYQGRSYIWDGSAWKNDSDYLEIGGRNLIRNFDAWNRLGGFNYDSQDKSINIVDDVNYYNHAESNLLYLLDNTTYTLVVEVPNIIGDCIVELQSRPDSVGNNKIVSTILNQGTNKFTFDSGVLPAGFTHYTLRFFGNSSSTPITVKIKNIKLEKGNIPTDWTPAPEDKANENQTINFDTNNIEPTQSGTVTKTSTWLWQYLTQSINFLWLKLKDLFSDGSATTNNNYLPKIDDVNKKLVKSNIYDNGTNVGIGTTNPSEKLEVAGNINLNGNQIKNVAIEVVTSLPTTDIVGRQVTYEGRSYIWDGSAWTNAISSSGGTVTGQFKLYGIEDFGGCYMKKSFGPTSQGTSYAALDAMYKDGTYHRVWKLSFPSGVNFWGKIKITISGNYSSFNASGVMSKVINCNFNTSSLYNNVGYYTDLGLLVETDFRISEAIWNSTTSCWEIWILSKQLHGNNNITSTIVEAWAFNDTTLTAAKGITYTNSAVAILDNTTSYTALKANYDGSSKTVLWATNPVYEDPYGRPISDHQVNFDTSLEPTQSGTVTKTSTWLWQYLVQSVNFLWLKLKGLFSAGSVTTNNNYLPKIDDVNKKLVKSNIQDDGTTLSYTGNLDLKGNQIKNAGFDVVTSLPTTGNFIGRQVTYQGRSYIWDGSEWESNKNWLNVYIDGTIPYMYAKLFTISNPYQNIELNLRPLTYALGNSPSVNYLISFAYNRVVINKLSSNPQIEGGTYHYNLHIKKVTPSVFEIYVGMPIPLAYTDSLYADITNVRNSIVSSVELFQTLDTSDTTVWTSLLYDENYFTEFHSVKTNKLKVNGASISNETINFDTSNIEPTQSGTVTKTSTWLWQYLTQSVNFLWLKLKDLFPLTQDTTHNYIPKIDNALKKLVKSNIQDDGTTPKYGSNIIWHSGNDGSGSGLDADLLDGQHASDFATSTHNHDGTYSTTDTKNTAGATDTSSKIYLVGSTAQSANPQTYTHDTAYVDIDGNLYSGSSKTITNSDLETNQIVTPTLNPTWTVRNYAGTVISSPTNPSGGAITGTSIVLEYGFKPSITVKGKWITQAGYDNPTSCSGLCGTSLPASNVETAATSSINLYNSTTYSSTTVPITTSDYWTIFTPKKGITVSGSSLILPTGNISASARTQVTYQLPVYYGNVNTLTITEAIIEALSTKTWKNYQTSSKTISPTINSSDSEYWIYAYPAAWGNLSTISNADGDWTAAFTSSTVSITGAPGLAILYNYYITVNKGAFKSKTINFS